MYGSVTLKVYYSFFSAIFIIARENPYKPDCLEK